MTTTRSGRQRIDPDKSDPPETPAVPEVPVVFRQETAALDGSAGASRSLILGYVFAILGAVTFASKAIFIKLAYAEGMGVEALMALRMILALPVYVGVGVLSLRDRHRRGEGLPATGLVVQAVLIGVLGYWVAMYLDFLSLSLIPAQFNVLILMTYPLFVVIFGAAIFRFPVQIRAVIAFGISYVGLAIIFFGKLGSANGDVALGAGFILASAICFALYMLFAREVIGRMGPRLFTCVTMVAVAIMAIAQFFIFEPVSALAITPAAWGYTILLAVVVLGEMLTTRDIVGAALVIGGVGWFTLGRRR